MNLAVGLFLLGFVGADEYRLTTDREFYAPSEVVQLQFRNLSQKAVRLWTMRPTIYDETGRRVSALVVSTDIPAVAPGQSYPYQGWWRWRAVDSGKKPLAPGRYMAVVNVDLQDPYFSPLVVHTSFVISKTEGVLLTTEKPVYSSTYGDLVSIQITNKTDRSVRLGGSAPWKVTQGESLIYKPSSSPAVIPLPPGQSKVYFWDKSDLKGEWVGEGSYRITVGPVFIAGLSSPIHLSRIIALTLTGEVVAGNPFPLAVGNTWLYERRGMVPGAPRFETMSVTKRNAKGWVRMANLPHPILWVRLGGGAYPTVYSKIPLEKGLFRFNWPLNASYTFGERNFFSFTFRVGAVKEAVVTPAGRFPECYRLDVVEGHGHLSVADPRIHEQFWFARGVGLVQYSVSDFSSVGGNVVLHRANYSLRYARLRGSDGAWYSLGVNER